MTPTPPQAGERAEALLPCPFCGGTPRIDRDADMDGFGYFYFVQCKCGVRSGNKFASNGNDCPLMYQEVRDTWNTRTAIAALDSEESK